MKLMLLFASLISIASLATPADSIVRLHELDFQSSFEKDAFLQAAKPGVDVFSKLFLSSSPSPAEDFKHFQTKFSHTLLEITNSEGWKKKNEKKVKQIYQIIHNRFLTKYKEEVSFYHIVKTGTYNCVTASALYALFFEALGIPYNIKEKPTHIYLVAYPGTENIMVETTAPFSGFLTFDPAFKVNFVENLKKQKIIGGSDAFGKTNDELFDAYFFADDNISLRQLVGIQYLNESIFLLSGKQPKQSVAQAKKGNFFYQCTRSEYLLMAAVVTHLQEADTPLQKAELIGQAARLTQVGITEEMIQGDFVNLTHDVLMKKNDKALYQKCYEQIASAVTSTKLKEDLSYIFHYENGRVYYNQGNYARAKYFFRHALALQPNNVDLSGIFVACLAQSLRNVTDNHVILDTLKSYRQRFQSLNENVNFVSMLALAYGASFGDSFDAGKVKEAEENQKNFETLFFGDVSLSLLSPEAVAHAYSAGASYYFKKGLKAKARAMIEQGLKVVPNSYELKARRQMLNN